MTKLGVQVPDSTIRALERRTVRLATLVEAATRTSPEKGIRESGAQLVERLGEWLEDIKDLREVGDEDVVDTIRSFAIRLVLAEQRTEAWPIPKSVRAQATEAGTRRRRGRPRKIKNAA